VVRNGIFGVVCKNNKKNMLFGALGFVVFNN
jgi:hypothetical protein